MGSESRRCIRDYNKQIFQGLETTEIRHSRDILGRKLNEYESSATEIDTDEGFWYFAVTVISEPNVISRRTSNLASLPYRCRNVSLSYN